MKNVWRMVKVASLENSDGWCIVSTSIRHSSFTNISNIVGRNEMKMTSRSGASSAKAAENHAEFSTGSFKNGNRPVSFSTLAIAATKVTGIVQKMQRRTVSTRLITSPKYFLLLLFPTFFQLSKLFTISGMEKQGCWAKNRRWERRDYLLYENSLHKLWHGWWLSYKWPRLGVMNSLSNNICKGQVRKGNKGCIAGRSVLPALEFL